MELYYGIGIALIFKAGASSGGSDLLANIIQKQTNITNVSQILLIIDFFVITMLVITFKNVELGLYSLIAIYISTRIIEYIFEGNNYIKIVNIITFNDDVITNQILNDLKRGATVTKCIGAHTRNEYINITCIVTLLEINKLKRIIYKYDKNALVYIHNANEVLGKGFKSM